MAIDCGPDVSAPGCSPARVIEVDHRLADEAADLALSYDLRTLDALHLAAAMLLPPADLVVATWDLRLHAAALAVGRRVLPQGQPPPPR